jgi:ABC-2 type transport system permease protein
VLTLLKRSFGRVAWMTLSIVLLMVAFQLSILASAVSLERAGDFARLLNAVPEFVREAIGPALGSFAGMAVLIYMEPLVILLLCLFAGYVASEPAADVESGLVDLMLARPLPRSWLITRSLVLMTALVGGIVLAMGLANWLGLVWMAPESAAWPEPRTILLMMIHLFALAWCIGGVALGAAGTLSRRSVVLGLTTLFVVGTYMIHAVAELAGWFRILRWASPFHYFQGTSILAGDIPTARNLTFLFGLGAVGVAAAYLRFNRRDL